MSIPGSNLLDEAFGLIETTEIQYRFFQTRALNDLGLWVSTYGPFQDIEASVQSVNLNTYKQLGLDLQRDYVNIFVSLDVVDLGRDVSGDQFMFDGKLYQIESETTWFLRDGWVEAYGVMVKNGLPS